MRPFCVLIKRVTFFSRGQGEKTTPLHAPSAWCSSVAGEEKHGWNTDKHHTTQIANRASRVASVVASRASAKSYHEAPAHVRDAHRRPPGLHTRVSLRVCLETDAPNVCKTWPLVPDPRRLPMRRVVLPPLLLRIPSPRHVRAASSPPPHTAAWRRRSVERRPYVEGTRRTPQAAAVRRCRRRRRRRSCSTTAACRPG